MTDASTEIIDAKSPENTDESLNPGPTRKVGTSSLESGIDVLVIVDVQVDFTTGSLGNELAASKVGAIVDKAKSFEGLVVLTQDCHEPDYLDTQEGRLLPVEHCIKGTPGIELAEGLRDEAAKQGWKVYEKPTFGSVKLAGDLVDLNNRTPIRSIELIGFCTDICVVSNALTIKAHLPEVPIKVDGNLCAGTSTDAHEAALTTMRSCQIAC